ncbi:formyl transferase [Marinicrinis lubricantis]|uniref:Formyl transferase n=1 Tax=Marinicrinis lubricantis TaxID=2086470 RepID=A0ABW1ITX3_9BACL
MNVMLLTGSHPRHLYVASQLAKSGFLQALVVEEREALVPSPPANILQQDKENFIRHFADREASELRFFGDGQYAELASIPTLRVKPEELNGQGVVDWIHQYKPDAVISYGVHILRQSVLDVLPDTAWNIHGGLSPWYRGNITLFWPFYFLKPNWAGMTIHQLTSRLDGGDIIHHAVPELERGDGIHDVACKAVMQAAQDLVHILDLKMNGKEMTPVPQKSSGKLFTSADWHPQHLRLIYNTFNNDIVDKYLDGELPQHEPPLVKAF